MVNANSWDGFGERQWSAVARVLDAEGMAAGAAFLAGTGIVVTCAHVVIAAGSGPGGLVRLSFPGLNQQPQIMGHVLATGWRSPETQDVAMVRLDSTPTGGHALGLGSAAGCRGHRVASFGFPSQAPEGGHYGYAVAGELLPASPVAGVLLQLTDANDLTTGFSGGPVVDETTGLAIGMLTAISPPDAHLRGTGIAYATPTQVLREIWPELAEFHVCPYRGLEAFTTDQAGWFHGRTAAVQRVLSGLAGTRRALLLLGPSGAGKSSLIQAGVLPALAAGELPGADRWISVVVRPGQDLVADGVPATRTDIVGMVERLLACSPGATRALLIVDPVEELLTPSTTDVQAAAQGDVIRKITAAIDSTVALSVVLVMRDDFYPRLAALAPELLQAVLPGIVNVPATLHRQDLQDIITKPAAAVGLRCQDGLAERIVADVLAIDSADPKCASVTVLPLLELAMRQLWERRQDGWLTHQAYQRIGGVAGSLTTWSDGAIARLSEAQRRVAQRILTSLVRPAEPVHQVPAVRQQLSLSSLHDLAAGDEPAVGDESGRITDAVLTVLTDQRIVTTRTVCVGEASDTAPAIPVAELVHDALIRDWSMLRDWVDLDHRFQNWLRRADEQHLRWAERRNPDDLLHGTDLAEGVDWSSQRRLPHDIADFVAASRQRQQARVRRARQLNSILAVLLAVALTATGVALRQRQEAIGAQRAAVVGGLLDRADAARDSDPRAALRYAVAADAIASSAYTRANLVDTLGATPNLNASLEGHNGIVRAVAFADDGRLLATGSDDRTVLLWDLRVAGRPRPMSSPLLTHTGGGIAAVAFSHGGSLLASGSDDGTCLLWDLRNPTAPVLVGPPLRTPGGGGILTVAFTADGSMMATGGDGGATIWDVRNPAAPRLLVGPWGGRVRSLAFNADGSTLASAGDDGAVLWHVGYGVAPRQLSHPLLGRSASSVAFTAEGSTMATADESSVITSWDVRDRRAPRQLGRVPGGRVLTFSPDGTMLAAGDKDGVAGLWDVTDPAAPRQLARLRGHTATIGAIGFSSDNAAVATGSDDGTALLWSVTDSVRPRPLGVPLRADTGPVRSVAVSPRDGTVATGGDNGTAVLWNLHDPSRPTVLKGHTAALWSTAFDPSRPVLATASGDRTVILWDLTNPAAPHRLGDPLVAHVNAATTVAFTHDGSVLAEGSDDGKTILWDVREAAHPHRYPMVLRGHTAAVWSVAFSPDGHTLATASGDQTIVLWDVTDPAKPRRLGDRLSGHTDVVWSVAFSSDGHTLASASGDRTVILWDVTEPAKPRRLGDRISGHTDAVSSVAFSPDGHTLASGSGDGTVILWDVSNRTNPRRLGDPLAAHTDAVWAIAFTSDGNTLASGSADGTTIAWQVGGLFQLRNGARQRACQRTGRGLTPEEWSRYIVGVPYRRTC